MKLEPKTLKQVVARMQALIKKDPKLADMPVVYAIDEEGNAFNDVFFDATPGHRGEDEMFTTDDGEEINCVCIN